ncbi:RIBOSOMAL RNA PROCESSING 5 isoform X4 [Carex rostrata]
MVPGIEKNKKKMPHARNPKEVPKPYKSFKKSRKEDGKKEASKDLPSSLLLQDDDPDFPRGGASLLSRHEVAEARAEAEADFEREERQFGRKGKRDRRTKGPETQEDLGSLFGEGVTGKLPRFANRITLKNVKPGMRFWGVVVEVNPKDLVISLPGGLKGFVHADEISDILVETEKDTETGIFGRVAHVRQLLPCVVVKVEDDKKDGKGSKRIWISLRLSLVHKGLSLDAIQEGMVLTAQVKSVEDHGYILHFGPSAFGGFMPRKEGEGNMKSGQLMQCVVKGVDKFRSIVQLSSDPELIAKSFTKDIKGLSIDHLIPGMMVNARVTSILENGIMLSFLTYFTGTVDLFHLPNNLPSGRWKDEYSQHKKVVARILFIDPSTRAVGLTLNTELVLNKLPSINIKIGEIYDESRVVRVDKGIGLLVEIPSSPAPSPAYINMNEISDEQTSKLEKKFKENSLLRVRVLAFRHLEGVAIGTSKASAFENSVFTHSDVKPGMKVKAKVVVVDSFGAIVQFSSGVKALCPLPHMSELDIVKPPKKFQVGAQLSFKVLGCKSKRITVTHKKTLVKSKLDILASYADATEGLVTHGWISKIEKHGCFVKFYNGVQGFVPRSELDLQPGIEAESVYHVGQVVKCRINSSKPASKRINISFVISPKRIPKGENANLGTVVSAVVEHVTPSAVIVNVNASFKGAIYNEHLADYHDQASAFREVLKPGYKFDQLVVIDIEGNSLILSAKHSFIHYASEIPSDISQIHLGAAVHGYISNIIETGCFVRFLGNLTGFCPKPIATDEQVEDLTDAFYTGQSVRSHVLNANAESGRIKLSLKQSLCSSSDVSFIRGYFLTEDKIATLQSSNGDQDWIKSLSIGSLVECKVDATREFGVIVSFNDHSNALGFIANHQFGGEKLEEGSSVKAVVLDISRSDGLVDLSCKPELVSAASSAQKKKRRRNTTSDLELHEEVIAVVEIAKENYLVLSIPGYSYTIGYASITDYNLQKLPHKSYSPGQSVTAVVGALPSTDVSERLLLLLKTLSDKSRASSSKRAKKSNYKVGSAVEGEIVEIKPLELIVRLGTGLQGRVHITEVLDKSDDFAENPFGKYRIGQVLHARNIAKVDHSGRGGKTNLLELSVRPSLLQDEEITPPASDFNFSLGDIIRGYVMKIDTEWAWLTISRSVTAHIFILDASSEPNELEKFKNLYRVGQAVNGQIININKEKRLVRLKPLPASVGLITVNQVAKDNANITSSENLKKGDIVGGRIKKFLPGVGGLLVQVGPHLYGRVHYTELVDELVPEPLTGFHEGQFVKTKILDISRSSEGTMHVDLSLRASLLGIKSDSGVGVHTNRPQTMDDIQPNMEVQGYVKNVSPKGCFIMLSRTIDARILISHLSDEYIQKPDKAFPVGKLVHGKVMSVEASSKKVEVTLKKINREMRKADGVGFSNLHVGAVIYGHVRRVELYGLFITLDNSKLVGLCHVSEISDESIDDLHAMYKAGDRVKAKILKVDEAKNKISLGMKQSYFEDGSDGDIVLENNENDTCANEEVNIDMGFTSLHENGDTELSQAQSRASVPPLQVSLDESDSSDNDDNLTSEKVVVSGDDAANKKKIKLAKKKAKEERELEISAAEERSLKKDAPKSEEEFEKLVRSSPNSSYVWINYMAFMLDVADVEKARSIAERALRTINIREEEEKLNVWVAYFNLENKYGNPPEEAVKKTFQRALQLCDPKKLHLALLGMYERTEQHKLADELLARMTKKFKTSCKVWLRSAQNILKQGQDCTQVIVKRALLSLPQKKHIKFISQMAILEFKGGVPERGRSLFEGILREYPKRTDLWSVYLDQEIRLGDVEIIRALFERATSLILPAKKMKFLFKKYLDFEKSQGDEERIEHVKRKALEYVESSVASQ